MLHVGNDAFLPRTLVSCATDTSITDRDVRDGFLQLALNYEGLYSTQCLVGCLSEGYTYAFIQV